MSFQRIVHLTPPRITADNIQEKIICIRAHRERLFKVEAEIIHNKLICHNYGQGGAGWTFLFGCVQGAIVQYEQQLITHPVYRKPICVIGAGCYGLLTAITLAHKGYTVRVVTKDTPSNVSSYNAAGFFFPRPRKTATEYERSVFEQCGIASYKKYLQIIGGHHPFIKRGAYLLPAYYSPDIDPGFAPYLQQQLMPKPEPVLVDFGGNKQYQLMEYAALWMNSTELMQELHQEVERLGISIEHANITTFDDVPETVIFNCAGLGARHLAHDQRVIPVQGHLITLKDQPPMEQLQYMINVKTVMINAQGMPRDELIYFAPKQQGIVGITFIRGQDSLTNNQHEFDRLIKRCQDFFGTP